MPQPSVGSHVGRQDALQFLSYGVREPVAADLGGGPVPTALFWRAVLAFLLLPVSVAFLVPWLLRPSHRQLHATGIPVLIAGTALLLWCVRDFYVAGRGTLAPWAPPRYLVTIGLYRVSRNPMYIAVLIILCGWALALPSLALWAYAGCVAIAFHLRVLLHEEPWLARMHGRSWLVYRARVPRWLLFRSPAPPSTDRDAKPGERRS